MNTATAQRIATCLCDSTKKGEHFVVLIADGSLNPPVVIANGGTAHSRIALAKALALVEGRLHDEMEGMN